MKLLKNTACLFLALAFIAAPLVAMSADDGKAMLSCGELKN